MSFWNIALTFFLLANPIGNSPAVIALIKDFDFEHQKKIMFRESLLALSIALFFQYFGGIFLQQLDIRLFTVRMGGGILLLIVALNMIFAPSSKKPVNMKLREPLIVPISTPLIAGPALLTIIMSFTLQVQNQLKLSLAILTAWVAVTAVLVSAPYIQRILRKRGLAALEQLMGMILSMMAIGMTTQGISEFIEATQLLRS